MIQNTVVATITYSLCNRAIVFSCDMPIKGPVVCYVREQWFSVDTVRVQSGTGVTYRVGGVIKTGKVWVRPLHSITYML